MARDRFRTSRRERRGRSGKGTVFPEQLKLNELGARKYITTEELNLKIDRQVEDGYQKILLELGLIE